jgi:predicted LPLAT superfamily acyltransferase
LDTKATISSPPPAPQDASANWAQPGLGRNWQQRFFHWLIRVGGKTRAYHMSHIVTFWYVLFYPSIRRRCRYYLSRRFPGHKGWIRRFLDTYRLARTYGAALVDMTVLAIFGPRAISASSPDHDRLLQLCADPRGFVLLHAHVGSFQIGLSALARFPKQVSIVMIPETRGPTLLGPQSATMIDPRTGLQGVIAMTEALLHGDIVTMMGDRILGSDQNTAAVRFLGEPALFPITPYRLASATGTPVLVMAAPKISVDSYEIRVLKIIEVPPNLGRNAQDFAPYAQQFADCIEQFTQEFPWQYYNFYDLWSDARKRRPPGALE